MKKSIAMRLSILLSLCASAQLLAAPLSRVFCMEVVYRKANGLATFETDAAWLDFTLALERKELRPGISSASIQDCLSTYRDELDRGEFVLDGKKMLERLARVPAKSSAPSQRPSMGSVTLPDFGEVEVDSAPSVTSPEAVRSAQRSERYDALWKEFLRDLRKTMTQAAQANKMGSQDR